MSRRQAVIIGNATFVTTLLGIPSINKISHSMQRLTQTCRAPILVASNGQVEGIFGIADPLRPESK